MEELIKLIQKRAALREIRIIGSLDTAGMPLGRIGSIKRFQDAVDLRDVDECLNLVDEEIEGILKTLIMAKKATIKV